MIYHFNLRPDLAALRQAQLGPGSEPGACRDLDCDRRRHRPCLALAYVSGGRLVRLLISAYVEFIRNVPLILLVYLVFYGIPTAADISYDAITSFVVTLSVYAGAYLVEVFRAGLSAVPNGLIDAGKAIGLTGLQRLLYVRLPTMFRIVLPALSNTFVSLFKDTSVASVIAVPELTYGAQWINFNTFRIVEVYSIVTPMYLVTGYAILLGAAPARAPLCDRPLTCSKRRSTVCRFCGKGFSISLEAAVIVVVMSLVLGVVLGIAITYGPRLLRLADTGFQRHYPRHPYPGADLFRVLRAADRTGGNIGNFAAGITALTLFSTAQVIEICRGALQSIAPRPDGGGQGDRPDLSAAAWPM